MLKDEMVYCYKINDELGTHALCANRYIVKCRTCGKERPLLKSDLQENVIKPVKCKCGGDNEFRYWLDGIYTEEELKELERKVKNNTTKY